MTIGIKTKDGTPEPVLQAASDVTPVSWLRPARQPALGRADLHLWRIRAGDDGAALDACLPCLGATQRERAERMRHRQYRERYVRAQAGLRRILAGYLDCPPLAVAFRHGPAGKPYLAEPSASLFFNLTTTADLALVAVRAASAPELEVGVDCEQLRPRLDIMGVAKRMLDSDVQARLAAAAEEERLALFYRAWTALEADAKCDGRGLFRPRALGAERPAVRHCAPQAKHIAALASRSLPPVAEWHCYELH